MQELLCHLVEKSTTSQFNLLLLMIREGLDTGKQTGGNCRVRLRLKFDDFHTFLFTFNDLKNVRICVILVCFFSVLNEEVFYCS